MDEGGGELVSVDVDGAGDGDEVDSVGVGEVEVDVEGVGEVLEPPLAPSDMHHPPLSLIQW